MKDSFYEIKVEIYKITKSYIENLSDIYSVIINYDLPEDLIESIFNLFDICASLTPDNILKLNYIVLKYQDLSFDFLERNFNRFAKTNSIPDLIEYQNLPNNLLEFIIKNYHSNATIMTKLLVYQQLSENLIENSSHVFFNERYVLRDYLSRYQNLSKEFIASNSFYLNKVELEKNYYLMEKDKKVKVLEFFGYKCFRDYLIVAIENFNARGRYVPLSYFRLGEKLTSLTSINAFKIKSINYEVGRLFSSYSNDLIVCKVDYDDIIGSRVSKAITPISFLHLNKLFIK